jgi:hypothetical protein
VIARAPRAGWVFVSAAAVAGVVLAHAVAYALVLPDAHARSEQLQATGHGYWGVAVYLALALGAVAVARAVVSGAADEGSRAGPTPGAGFGPLAVRQVVFFALVEVSERAVVGAPVGGLWRQPAFVVGLVVQVAVAGVIAVLLRQAETLAARVVAALGDPHHRGHRRPRWWVPAGQLPPRRPLGSPARSRAPPVGAITP